MAVPATTRDPEETRSAPAQGGVLAPGAAAGVLGGLAMAAWIVASAALEGMDPLSPLALFGETYPASEPRGSGAATLAYGLALHAITSAVVGVLFTAVLPRDFPPGSAALVCVGFTFVVMGFMASLILPAVNPALRAEMPRLGGSWVLAHAAYGATVGATGAWLRRRHGLPPRA